MALVVGVAGWQTLPESKLSRFDLVSKSRLSASPAPESYEIGPMKRVKEVENKVHRYFENQPAVLSARVRFADPGSCYFSETPSGTRYTCRVLLELEPDYNPHRERLERWHSTLLTVAAELRLERDRLVMMDTSGRDLTALLPR